MTERPRLVIGASGLIGNILWRKLPRGNSQGTFFSFPVPNLVPLDIRDGRATALLLKKLSPSVVFVTAAMPSADGCEMEPEKCWAVNVTGIENIVRAAKDLYVKLIFFSSDYVFNGQGGPYGETDEPNPINVYGRAKLAAERLIQDQLDDYLIVRVNVVYGCEERRKNFVTGLIDRLCRGERVKVPVDQLGSPTYADNMVDIILELVELNQKGIFHVAGDEVMDRYAFACQVADIFDLDRHLLVPVQTAELRQKAARPLSAGLRVEKLKRVVSTRLVPPREGLRLMKAEGNSFVVQAGSRQSC